ncbi:MAG: SUMF1/EgtB/PvdO family nonheme iron enzyme [Planctomycetota bacterium]|jgi:formylglycine-generating enzyme required for sulfatase activity|nr:SUMF1/EgtB/PvdO family nonheme iron enzyme [Planctomycetota bacterium]
MLAHPSVLMAILAVLLGAPPVNAASVWLQESPQDAKAYEERISGTTVSIEMVPVSLPATPSPSTSASAPGDKSPAEGELQADGQAVPPSSTIWFSAHEVTWDAFDAFLYRLDKPDPSVPDAFDALVQPSAAFVLADRGYGHAGYPAISVNHTAATSFCEWLSAKTGRRYRLPTQAEWVAACLAGDGSWIESSRKGFQDSAWVHQTADRKTHPVGSLEPNPFGLYDMLGNTAEWCVDEDGTAVLRGGSFRDRAQDVHADHVQEPSPAWNATDPQIPKSAWWLADADFAGFRIVSEEAPSAIQR